MGACCTNNTYSTSQSVINLNTTCDLIKNSPLQKKQPDRDVLAV